jgi:hypothetical protein
MKGMHAHPTLFPRKFQLCAALWPPSVKIPPKFPALIFISNHLCPPWFANLFHEYIRSYIPGQVLRILYSGHLILSAIRMGCSVRAPSPSEKVKLDSLYKLSWFQGIIPDIVGTGRCERTVLAYLPRLLKRTSERHQRHYHRSLRDDCRCDQMGFHLTLR